MQLSGWSTLRRVANKVQPPSCSKERRVGSVERSVRMRAVPSTVWPENTEAYRLDADIELDRQQDGGARVHDQRVFRHGVVTSIKPGRHLEMWGEGDADDPGSGLRIRIDPVVDGSLVAVSERHAMIRAEGGSPARPAGFRLEPTGPVG